MNDDIVSFRKGFNNLIGHTSLCILSHSILEGKRYRQQIINFANLTNFVALKGGKLKREQMLSGDMADIFSNLYLSLSVYNYHLNYNSSKILTDYIISKLINENQIKINRIIDNLGPERFLLQHMKKNPKNISYDEERKVFNEIMNNKNIINEILKMFILKIIS